MNNHDETQAKWIGAPELSDRANIELAVILSTNVKSSQFIESVTLLNECTIVQQVLGPLEVSQSLKDLQEILESDQKHLHTLERNSRRKSGLHKQLLDQSTYAANEFDRSFIELPSSDTGSQVHDRVLSAQKRLSALIEESKSIDAEIESISRGVNSHLDQMSEPTKMRHEYSNAIQLLAEGFKAIFPDEMPSDHPNSKFSRLVVFWMREHHNKHIAKPHRHIQKVLEPFSEFDHTGDRLLVKGCRYAFATRF